MSKLVPLARPSTQSGRGAVVGAAILQPLASVVRLLAPRWLGVRNRLWRLDRRGWLGVGGIASLALVLWGVVFALFYRALAYLLQAGEFGPLLTYKLLAMVLVGFFSVLLFSNVITALSTFYLSRDLDRLCSAPVAPAAFFAARLIETAAESSWMVLMFAVPAFVAFGVAHGGGLGFYLSTAMTLAPFLMIPAALGVLLAALLVSVLPARRMYEFLWLLAIIAIALVYLLLRMLRPERLLQPEGFGDFVEFFADLRAPAASYLPSTWAAEIIHPDAGNTLSDVGFYGLLLVTTAAVLVMACEMVVSRLHPAGWSKAQEGRLGRGATEARWERALRSLLGRFDGALQAIIVKEVKVFLRDSGQWSQLILLLSLVVVYVYNFSVLPEAGGPLVTFYFRNVVSFMNLALAAFVTAAVAVRFVYPSISLEGRAFWVLQSSPMDLRRLWWAKFWVMALPLLLLSQVLVVVTNTFLGVTPLMQWISVATMLGLVVALVSLGLWAGAVYPRFHVENAAKISAGTGGVLYMTLCMLLIAAVVLLEAWPVYTLFHYRLSGESMPMAAQAGVLASFAAAGALCIGVFVVCQRRGVEGLREIEL